MDGDTYEVDTSRVYTWQEQPGGGGGFLAVDESDEYDDDPDGYENTYLPEHNYLRALCCGWPAP